MGTAKVSGVYDDTVWEFIQIILYSGNKTQSVFKFVERIKSEGKRGTESDSAWCVQQRGAWNPDFGLKLHLCGTLVQLIP